MSASSEENEKNSSNAEESGEHEFNGPAKKKGRLKTSDEERGREEFKWNPSMRRMDSLARLLSGNSKCVAVAVIGKKLCISANELKALKRKSKPKKEEGEGSGLRNSIASTVNYFGNKPGKDRVKEFTRICLERVNAKRIADKKPKLTEGEEEATEAAAKAILNRSEISEAEKLKNSELYELLKLVRKDFRKMEVLNEKKDYDKKDFDKFANDRKNEKWKDPKDSKENKEDEAELKKAWDEEKQSLIALSQAIKNEHKLIESDENPNNAYKFHAESIMARHILEYVLQNKDDINKEISKEKPLVIYIGIAKLCCLNCRCFLKSINEYFDTKDIHVRLRWRGRHDLAFAWDPPLPFYEAYRKGVKEEMNKELKDGGCIEKNQNDSIKTGKDGGKKYLVDIYEEEEQKKDKNKKISDSEKEYLNACSNIGYATGKKVIKLTWAQKQKTDQEASPSDSDVESVTEERIINQAKSELESCLTMSNFFRERQFGDFERGDLYQVIHDMKEIKVFDDINYSDLATPNSEAANETFNGAVTALLDKYKRAGVNIGQARVMELLKKGLVNPTVVGERYANYFKAGIAKNNEPSSESRMSFLAPLSSSYGASSSSSSASQRDEKALEKIAAIHSLLDEVYPPAAKDHVDKRKVYLLQLADYEKRAQSRLLSVEERGNINNLLETLQREHTKCKPPFSYTN